MRTPFSRRIAASALLVSAMLASGLAPASSAAVRRPPARQPLAFSATVLPEGGGEPNVSISPNGRTVLVSGLGATPASLWRSTDGGRTFRAIEPQFSDTGGGDWDMRWLDATRVVAADLALGTGVYIHRSADAGLTWTTTSVQLDVYDRPWLGVAGETVYLVAKGFDQIPQAFVSEDAGATFSPTPIPVYGTGTVPANGGGSPTPAEAMLATNTYIDSVATDPRTSDLYVLYGLSSVQGYGPFAPLGNPNRLYVAHLQDGPTGRRFVSRAVYLGAPEDAFIDGFNWLTVDRRGTLYVLANGLHQGVHSLWLTSSRDRGATWSRFADLGEPGAANVFGAIAAGTPGTLALVYLRGSVADPSVDQDWFAELATVTAADTGNPRVRRVRPVAKAIHTEDICFYGILCGFPGFGDNRDLLDYIWIAVTPGGRAIAVVASDGPATGGDEVDVVVLRQTSGPTHGRGVPS